VVDCELVGFSQWRESGDGSLSRTAAGRRGKRWIPAARMAGFVSRQRSVGGGGSSQQGRWIRAARTAGVGRGQRPAAGAVGGGDGARWEAVVSNPNFSLVRWGPGDWRLGAYRFIFFLEAYRFGGAVVVQWQFL
jgi:hypothetical protein